MGFFVAICHKDDSSARPDNQHLVVAFEKFAIHRHDLERHVGTFRDSADGDFPGAFWHDGGQS